jgi:hypothetical protein
VTTEGDGVRWVRGGATGLKPVSGWRTLMMTVSFLAGAIRDGIEVAGHLW